MQTISVMTPCFNEEANIQLIYEEIKNIFSHYPQYNYEHIFIDNASSDKTPAILRSIAAQDPCVKVIFNMRNFGGVRSPVYGVLQARGDAVIYLAADFQDPPALIPEFIKKWEEGYKAVVGVKPKSDESAVLFYIRKLYYKFINTITDTKLINNFTGFGLYDQSIIEHMRQFGDAYPYFRGMISEIGCDIAEIEFRQPTRKRGVSSQNFYQLYTMAMLGITNHSKLPIRIATIGGFTLSLASFIVAVVYIFLKLFFWQAFPLGVAPLLIGGFLFFSIQMFFIGLLGEYIVSIHTQVMNRPLVIEKERINFSTSDPEKLQVVKQ